MTCRSARTDAIACRRGSGVADPWTLLRPLLFGLDPERAHGLALRAGAVLGMRAAPADDPILAIRCLGIDFSNPLGMAAGFDKDARLARAFGGLGFGFAEVGTVTPLPQAGNPRPRVFRLEADRALVNRLGFNNAGHAAMAARLGRARAGRRPPVPLGINIGANKDSADRIGDYVAGIERLWPLADFFTVNISSPNTPGLRDLQSRDLLAELVGRVVAARDAKPRRVPLLLKIAPDLDDRDLADIAARAEGHGLDGFVVSNTTLAREKLRSPARGEAGGLSGAPLFARSTALLADMHRATGGGLTLVGVGGVASGADARAKIAAGASLVELYTALVYEGPGLIARIKRELADILRREGIADLSDAVGRGMDQSDFR